MGQTSCSYFTGPEVLEADSTKEAPTSIKDDSKDEPLRTNDVFPTSAPPKSSAAARTAFRPPSEMLKDLKAQESKKAAQERWAKTKSEWQAHVIAELEEREKLNKEAAGTEPDRYGADERQRALQAIKEEEESRQQSEEVKAAGPEEDNTVAAAKAEEVEGKTDETETDRRLADDIEVLVPVKESAEDYEDQKEGAYGGEQKMDGSPAKIEQESSDETQAAERKALLTEFLTKNGFDGFNQKQRRGLRPSIYPLHLAAERGDAQIIALLLEAGADRQRKNYLGRTAQDVARKKNCRGSHDEALALLTSL